jgi:hypothetical protein
MRRIDAEQADVSDFCLRLGRFVHDSTAGIVIPVAGEFPAKVAEKRLR